LTSTIVRSLRKNVVLNGNKGFKEGIYMM